MILTFDESLTRSTLRDRYQFNEKEQKMHEDLMNEISFDAPPEPSIIRQQLRRADKDQQRLVRYKAFLNLSKKQKIKTGSTAANFWSTTKQKRPARVEEPEAEEIDLDDDDDSSSGVSSDEDTNILEELEKDVASRDSSLLRQLPSHHDRIIDALDKFPFPRLANKL